MMDKLKILNGLSGENSVLFFLEDCGIGVEATRLKDGSIIANRISYLEQEKNTRRFVILFFVLGLFREFSFSFTFLNWLYHIPTSFSLLLLASLIWSFRNAESRMYHGAENKVMHWYTEKLENEDYFYAVNKFTLADEIEKVQKCSTIHGSCYTNLFPTIVTFQLISSFFMHCYHIHIPEIITTFLPFFVYTIFPLNIFGLIVQTITTATPKKEHIAVAIYSLVTLLNEKEIEEA